MVLFSLARPSAPRIRSFLSLSLAACTFLACPIDSSFAQPAKAGLSSGPQTITSKERVSVLIDREIDGLKSFIVLKISVPNDSKINAFSLTNPARLVVDFEGASIKKSEDFQAPANSVVRQIRLGAHPSKLRVVIDLIAATPPEYEWKAGKRQAILKIFEREEKAEAKPVPTIAPTTPPIATVPVATATIVPTITPAKATPAPALPSQTATPAAQPTKQPATSTATATATHTASPTLTATKAPVTIPTTVPTAIPTIAPTTPPQAIPTETSKPTLSDVEGAAGIGGAAAPAPAKGAPQAAALPDLQTGGDEAEMEDSNDLGDLEEDKGGTPEPKVPTSFSITGYKFERLPDKSPILKIILNKPRAQAQISKVDDETYKIEIKDCGLANEDLELPQFPPHDFVGFVMVVSETVGKNTEISVSVESDTALTTSVHEQEIWVKKP
jgi:hypothetical protein